MPRAAKVKIKITRGSGLVPIKGKATDLATLVGVVGEGSFTLDDVSKVISGTFDRAVKKDGSTDTALSIPELTFSKEPVRIAKYDGWSRISGTIDRNGVHAWYYADAVGDKIVGIHSEGEARVLGAVIASYAAEGQGKFIVSSAPAPGTSRTLAWGRPLLIVGGPTYYWPDIAEADIDAHVAAIAAAGADAIGVELSGRTSEPGHPVVDILAVTWDHINRLKPWVAACRKYGIWLYVSFANSNADSWKKVTDDQKVTNLARYFVDTLGTANILLLGVSENDSDMTERLRNAVRKYFRQPIFPADQLVEMSKDVDSRGFTETHLQSAKAIMHALGWRYINSTDSGAILAFLFGSDWKNNPKPNYSRILTLAKACRDAGVTFYFYGFEKLIDLALLRQLAAVWKGQLTDQTTGTDTSLEGAHWRNSSDWKSAAVENVLVSGTIDEQFVKWKTAGSITWDNIGKSKYIEADICIFRQVAGRWTGGKFDGVGKGQRSKDWKNIRGSGNYLGKDFHPTVGEPLLICLIGKRNGKRVRSNAVRLEAS